MLFSVGSSRDVGFVTGPHGPWGDVDWTMRYTSPPEGMPVFFVSLKNHIVYSFVLAE
jgi:hypothetical protein